MDWETAVNAKDGLRRAIAARIIDEFELDIFMFLSDHFSCPVFKNYVDYLTMDYFWLQAWVELGVIRQKQLQEIETERERKTQEIMKRNEEMAGPTAFDKLNNLR